MPNTNTGKTLAGVGPSKWKNTTKVRPKIIGNNFVSSKKWCILRILLNCGRNCKRLQLLVRCWMPTQPFTHQIEIILRRWQKRTRIRRPGTPDDRFYQLWQVLRAIKQLQLSYLVWRHIATPWPTYIAFIMGEQCRCHGKTLQEFGSTGSSWTTFWASSPARIWFKIFHLVKRS